MHSDQAGFALSASSFAGADVVCSDDSEEIDDEDSDVSSDVCASVERDSDFEQWQLLMRSIKALGAPDAVLEEAATCRDQYGLANALVWYGQVASSLQLA